MSALAGSARVPLRRLGTMLFVPLGLFAMLLGGALLGSLCSVCVVVPYWSVERRARHLWRPALRAALSIDRGERVTPYRSSATRRDAGAPSDAPRAPALVRFAALASFLLAWCFVAWVTAIASGPRASWPLALPAIALAWLTQLAARRLLRRAHDAPTMATRVAIANVAHGVAMALAGAFAFESLGRSEALAWLTMALGVAEALVGASIVTIARTHATEFERASSSASSSSSTSAMMPAAVRATMRR